MLNYQEIIEEIANIEADFDVTSLKIGDTYVWPLIRRHIGNILVQATFTNQTKSKLFQRKYLFARSQQVTKVLLKRIRDIYYFNPKAFDHKNLGFKENQADILFISRPEDNTDLVNGLIYNRHIDPFIELTERYSLNYFKLEENIGKNSQKYFYQPNFYKNTKEYSSYSLLSNFHNVANFDELQIHLKKQIPQLHNEVLSQHEIIYEYERILLRKNYFLNIFKKINPKIAFLVCYYSNEVLPIVWACKELGIISVDIQHGKQGKYHQMYSHWTKFPDQGYDLLPDYFWNWGTPSKNNIAKWHPENLKNHIPIVGGNLWLAKWKHGYTQEFENQYRSFLNDLDQKKLTQNLILITLQTLPNPIEDFVLRVMQETQEENYWLIRLHPVQKDKKDQIEEAITKWNIRNYDIINSTQSPLYSLLKRINLHLTAWSSTSIEALYFNKHTIIIHANGQKLYKEYIDKNQFSLALNYESLLKQLKQLLNSKIVHKNTNIENNYIETNEYTYNKAFQYLLSQAKN